MLITWALTTRAVPVHMRIPMTTITWVRLGPQTAATTIISAIWGTTRK